MKCLDENTAAAFVQALALPQRMAEIELHLEECDACRDFIVEFAKIFGEPTATIDTTPVSASSIPALPRGARLERYMVLECVGSGAMSVVYAAYDPELDRKVAIKVMRPRASPVAEDASVRDHRLLVEARAIARLEHPNVVRIFDARLLEGDLFIAMEPVDGRSLRRWLGDGEDNDWRERLRVCLDAGKGLGAAHLAGIVHRDFKPENILVDKRGCARVLDFGLALAIDGGTGVESTDQRVPSASESDEWSIRVTRAGHAVGTPAYMAPEQMAAGSVAEAADQYALCVVVWEALYGTRPHRAWNFDALLSEKLSEAPLPRPSGPVPAGLHRVLCRGLSPNPAHRWPSVAVLLDELRRAQHARRRFGWSVGALAAIALLGLTGLGTSSPSSLCDAGQALVAQTLAGAHAAGREGLLAHVESSSTQTAATRVDEHLQRWENGWTVAYKDACEAVQTGGAEHDARVVCLQRAREQLAAVLTTVAEGDVLAVAHGVEAVQAAADLSACDDVRAPSRFGADPGDEPSRAALQAVHAQLQQARAARLAGRYSDAEDLADQAVALARTLAFELATAETVLELGRAQIANGHARLAWPNAERAVELATASGDDELPSELTSGASSVGAHSSVAHTPASAWEPTPHAAKKDSEVTTITALHSIFADLTIWRPTDARARRMSQTIDARRPGVDRRAAMALYVLLVQQLQAARFHSQQSPAAGATPQNGAQVSSRRAANNASIATRTGSRSYCAGRIVCTALPRVRGSLSGAATLA